MCDVNPAARLFARCKKKKKNNPSPQKTTFNNPRMKGPAPSASPFRALDGPRSSNACCFVFSYTCNRRGRLFRLRHVIKQTTQNALASPSGGRASVATLVMLAAALRLGEPNASPSGWHALRALVVAVAVLGRRAMRHTQRGLSSSSLGWCLARFLLVALRLAREDGQPALTLDGRLLLLGRALNLRRRRSARRLGRSTAGGEGLGAPAARATALAIAAAFAVAALAAALANHGNGGRGRRPGGLAGRILPGEALKGSRCGGVVDDLLACARVQLLHFHDEVLFGHALADTANRKSNLLVVVGLLLLCHALPPRLLRAAPGEARPTSLERRPAGRRTARAGLTLLGGRLGVSIRLAALCPETQVLEAGSDEGAAFLALGLLRWKLVRLDDFTILVFDNNLRWVSTNSVSRNGIGSTYHVAELIGASGFVSPLGLALVLALLHLRSVHLAHLASQASE